MYCCESSLSPSLLLVSFGVNGKDDYCRLWRCYWVSQLYAPFIYMIMSAPKDGHHEIFTAVDLQSLHG